MARIYQEAVFDFGGRQDDYAETIHTPAPTDEEYEQALVQAFPPDAYHVPFSFSVASQAPCQNAMVITWPTQLQLTAADTYGNEQDFFQSPPLPPQLSYVESSSQHDSVYESSTPRYAPQLALQQLDEQPQLSRKRQRSEDFFYSGSDMHRFPVPEHQAQSNATRTAEHIDSYPSDVSFGALPPRRPSHDFSISPQPLFSPDQQQKHSHHHHYLPTYQTTASRAPRSGTQEGSSADETGPPNVVGQPGMPDAAPRPRGPKLKFTPEDDALLTTLKETKDFTWRQIADFFPGRSSGTLQVRYCTKLKVKDTTWTDEMTQKLVNAIDEYETHRWRWVAGKVGHGVSATTCREKAVELDTLSSAFYDMSELPGSSVNEDKDVNF